MTMTGSVSRMAARQTARGEQVTVTETLGARFRTVLRRTFVVRYVVPPWHPVCTPSGNAS